MSIFGAGVRLCLHFGSVRCRGPYNFFYTFLRRRYSAADAAIFWAQAGRLRHA